MNIGRLYTPLDYKLAEQEIEKLGKRYGLPIDPLAIIEELPVGLRQRVEILKMLFREAQLFIFDEPTAVLTPSEVEELYCQGMLKEIRWRTSSGIFSKASTNSSDDNPF